MKDAATTAERQEARRQGLITKPYQLALSLVWRFGWVIVGVDYYRVCRHALVLAGTRLASLTNHAALRTYPDFHSVYPQRCGTGTRAYSLLAGGHSVSVDVGQNRLIGLDD